MSKIEFEMYKDKRIEEVHRLANKEKKILLTLVNLSETQLNILSTTSLVDAIKLKSNAKKLDLSHNPGITKYYGSINSEIIERG